MPIIASACLCGVPCRYNGSDACVPELRAAAEAGLIVPVCPECDAGLPIPRYACELIGQRVVDNVGSDYTQAFQRGAQHALKTAKQHNAYLAILKDKSPSCGSVWVYDGTFSGRLIPGMGLAASLLVRNGITVCTEETWMVRLSLL